MKNKVCFCFCLFLSVDCFPQSFSSPVKGPALAIHFILTDFKTADLIHKSSLGSVLNNKDWARIKDMKAGFGLQYLQGWNKYVDFSARMNVTFLDYPFQNKASLGSESLLMETEGALHAKLLPDKYFFVPYASGGLGVSLYKNYVFAYLPLGGGVQFNLGNSDAFVFTQMQYSIPITAMANYCFLYSFGLAANLSAKK